MTTTISDVLQHLMFIEKIRTTELSRRTGLPQPTLHRIVQGLVASPHKTSLVTLANYFKISLEQLQGLEPLDERYTIKRNEIKEVEKLITRTTEQFLKKNWMEVPIFSNTQLQDWPNHTLSENSGVLLLPKSESTHENSLGYIVEDSAMAPLCQPGSTVIVDPKQGINDRQLILFRRKESQQFLVRQVVLDGEICYLKPLSPDFRDYALQPLQSNDIVVGTVIQVQTNL